MKLIFWLLLSCLIFGSAALADDEAIPRFEPTNCRFEPLFSGTTCGDLIVLENRDLPRGSTIRIHVGIVKATAETPQPDPIIFLSGGPGAPTLEYRETLYGFAALNIDRDIIIFDQRGIGLSQPALNCPYIGLSNFERLGENLSSIERSNIALEDFRFCRRTFGRQGIDLAHYNTLESAADVNDLRLALGYQQWNLYGISYGTLLGLEIMRNFPEGVRSAVLMGVVPPQVNWITELPANAERAFETFFQACAADQQCSEDYPNLEGMFYDLVVGLNKNPEEITLNVFEQERTVTIRGEIYVQLLFSVLYVPQAIREMPQIIAQALEGDHEIAAYFQINRMFADAQTSVGMTNSVVCADTIGDTSSELLAEADQAFPFQFDAFDMEYYAALCDIWDVEPSELNQRTPVSSDIPVLLLSGQFDPVTPARYGEIVAQTLSNSFHYELPNIGHGSGHDPCARRMIQHFIDNPQQEPNADCIARIPAIRFRSPED